jgi:tetratricopeptide (TPR) repeat protein
MDAVNTDLVERYQMILESDPTSKVFAPLAEAYRKMGMIQEALRISEAGVAKHPQFPSGRVALAKILLEMGEPERAIEQLKVAVELSPENILAHSLLAEAQIQMKKPREALKAFKMVLFLNPRDEKAQKTIRKLESLTASEYDEEVFKIQKLPDMGRGLNPESSISKQRTLERFISLADAYTVRSDAEKAFETLESAENVLGPHPEIDRRKSLLKNRLRQTPVIEEIEMPPIKTDSRVSKLEKWLHRINERRSV